VKSFPAILSTASRPRAASLRRPLAVIDGFPLGRAGNANRAATSRRRGVSGSILSNSEGRLRVISVPPTNLAQAPAVPTPPVTVLHQNFPQGLEAEQLVPGALGRRWRLGTGPVIGASPICRPMIRRREWLARARAKLIGAERVKTRDYQDCRFRGEQNVRWPNRGSRARHDSYPEADFAGTDEAWRPSESEAARFAAAAIRSAIDSPSRLLEADPVTSAEWVSGSSNQQSPLSQVAGYLVNRRSWSARSAAYRFAPSSRVSAVAPRARACLYAFNAARRVLGRG
jgi:hypothetical protein